MRPFSLRNPGFVALPSSYAPPPPTGGSGPPPAYPGFVVTPGGTYRALTTAQAEVVSAEWLPDSNAAAYPVDEKGAYAYELGDAPPQLRWRLWGTRVLLNALSGFGCNGPLRFAITRVSDNQVVYTEDINQAGANDGGGSNRAVALPDDDYYVDVIRVGGVVAVDGIQFQRIL